MYKPCFYCCPELLDYSQISLLSISLSLLSITQMERKIFPSIQCSTVNTNTRYHVTFIVVGSVWEASLHHALARKYLKTSQNAELTQP